jgi:hypothetical protein
MAGEGGSREGAKARKFLSACPAFHARRAARGLLVVKGRLRGRSQYLRVFAPSRETIDGPASTADGDSG